MTSSKRTIAEQVADFHAAQAAAIENASNADVDRTRPVDLPDVVTATLGSQGAETAARIRNSEDPAALRAAFGAELAALNGAGVPAGVAAAGATMPDGHLLDVASNGTSLTEAREGQAAVVVFYRGAWCPYCNVALRTYQNELVPALTGRQVKLIAISPQAPDGSLTMQEANELTYTVLSDPGNQIAGTLGILTRPSDDARAAQESLGVDIAGGNADGTDSLPMPTVVIVDAAGIIRWIDVHPNYATRTETEEILGALALSLD
ncbi:peroxiredoxin-like family protein [Streptomyces sp. NPDC051954]|uniref:peroxiredoxin-like family protein n=1 Tax=unclassified Streptomyces TaxID=2593676 RepID=UPI0034324137